MSKKDTIIESGNGSLLQCRIQPSASKTAFAGIYDGALKFSLAAPPVDGKANKALCAFIAKQLKIPKNAVTIKSGEKSRHKTVFCENRTKSEISAIFKIF